jgi:alkaline phosphatase D
MQFLATNNIKNVVAVTGDIHAFYAGEVPVDYANYQDGQAAMVDLVTAGISSSSFWSYLASVVGDFETDVKAVLAARSANPTAYINSLESGTNPFSALRTLVYVCPNMLIYSHVKEAVLKNTALDLTTSEGREAAYRIFFEEYLKTINAQNLNNAQGYQIFNTLNETFAGNMGQTIQAVSQQLGVTIPNPYTDTNTPPPVQNPWIKYVETDTQGFITVKVTPTQVEAKFHHIETLAKSPTASSVIASNKTKTAIINSGISQVQIS